MRTSDNEYHKAQRRLHREAGHREIRVWLSPERQADLKTIQQDTGLSAQAAISGAIWIAAQEIRSKCK